MSPRFQDHFGGHAEAYAAARPTYPDALFDWVASVAPDTRTAWDCATGSGQAALGLARHFATVHATDASAGQLAAATPHPRVSYAVAPAEASGLPDHSVDAITVAEALHWFDHPAFLAEVRRVLRPGGVVFCWGYHHTQIAPAVDEAVLAFRARIADDWPPGRELLDGDYRDIPWDLEGPTPPDLALGHDWTVERFLAYLRTWSAVKRHEARTGRDPVARCEASLRLAWGEVAVREVTWPLCWRTGRVEAPSAPRRAERPPR